MKGMNETALQCKHTGGCPPLGYDLDENRHLIVNEWEAQAVKIIFQMFADGYGYSEIIDRLNAHGYKTKRARCSGRIAFMRFFLMRNILVFLCSIRQLQEQMASGIITPKRKTTFISKVVVRQLLGKAVCTGAANQGEE